MVWPEGRFSINRLAQKSASGDAVIGGKAMAFLNDSVVETSTSICDVKTRRPLRLMPK